MSEKKMNVVVEECPCNKEICSLEYAAAFFSAEFSARVGSSEVIRDGVTARISKIDKEGENIIIITLKKKGDSFIGFAFVGATSDDNIDEMIDFAKANGGGEYEADVEIKCDSVVYSEKEFSITLPETFVKMETVLDDGIAMYTNIVGDMCQVHKITNSQMTKLKLKKSENTLNKFRVNQMRLVPWYGLYAIKEKDEKEYMSCRTKKTFGDEIMFFDSFVFARDNGYYIVNVGGLREDVFDRIDTLAIGLSFSINKPETL